MPQVHGPASLTGPVIVVAGRGAGITRATIRAIRTHQVAAGAAEPAPAPAGTHTPVSTDTRRGVA